MKDNKTTILKVLVGSQSHSLANAESDYDYRGVFVQPTSDMLRLGAKIKNNSWIEGKVDQTMYEIGHFLHLACKSNPSILEVFKAPMQQINPIGTGEKHFAVWGDKLVDLFPYVWNPNDAFNAFTGYASNQRTKMFQRKDNKQSKFAVAYIRTLINLCDLLETGTFSLEIKDEVMKKALLKIKNNNDFDFGEVVSLCESLILRAKLLKDKCTHEPNIDKVNEFLLEIRKEFWE